MFYSIFIINLISTKILMSWLHTHLFLQLTCVKGRNTYPKIQITILDSPVRDESSSQS